MNVAAEYFEAMYRESQDPWSLSTRWYERRKYALTVAALPRARYRSAFEPGCSVGELSALLEVVDTGIGISPEHQMSVFERFFRIDPDRGASGAGLGLAITRSICAAHGGSVTLHSEPGLGCTFRVTLPTAPHSSSLP